MSVIVAVQNQTMSQIESVLIGGDLSKLTAPQREFYYKSVCESLGLNPLTKPFDYITLNGKLVLYASKGCAEQLRSIRKISITITAREMIGELCVVTANAKGPDGREDSSTGVVNVGGLKGEMLANAMMKAETKAKRRVTLSICGLNMLDETEVETIPQNNLKVHGEQPPETDGFTPDRFIIEFGKWNRKTLEQVYRDEGPKAIADYIQYIEDSAKKKGAEVAGKALVFIQEAERFLGVMENAEVES